MLIRLIKLSFVAILFVAINASAKQVTVGLSVWSGYPNNISGFKSSLTSAGFIENKNITYLYRNAGADKARQLEIAKEFAEKKVDLVYSLTTPGTIIIKNQVPATTPVVFSIVTYPADSGLIESFDYSGNNLVGTSNFVPYRYYVDLLQSILPDAKTVAIFHREGEPNSILQTVNLIRLFKRGGIKAINVPVSTIENTALRAKELSEKVDAFVTTTDTLMQSGAEAKLIEISKLTKTPILSSNKQGVIDGAAFGPVIDFNKLGRMSGEMAVKILKAKVHPSNLESKLQDPPSVLVNRSSIELLGLTLPESIQNISYVK